MGDSPESSRKNPALLAGEIVGMGIKNPPMRDEIYCQLAKQTKGNPESLSAAQGWKLMALTASAFAPTRAFQEYVMNYLQSNFGPTATPSSSSSASSGGGAPQPPMSPSSASENAASMLSRYSHWKVMRTISHFGVDEKLTLNQLDDMLSRGVKSFQVLFPGNLEYIVHLQCVEKNAVSQSVPEIMVRMCQQIKAAGGFSAKGIFRIAAQREHVTGARARIENGNWLVPAAEAGDPHTPADVLKVWLRELLTPVIPMSCYETCLKICDNEAECVALVERELSPVHKASLDYLLTFLAALSTHEKETSMGAENLAIVFSQDLLRTEEKDPVVLYKNSAKEKNFVRQLIIHWGKKKNAQGDGAAAAAAAQ